MMWTYSHHIVTIFFNVPFFRKLQIFHTINKIFIGFVIWYKCFFWRRIIILLFFIDLCRWSVFSSRAKKLKPIAIKLADYIWLEVSFEKIMNFSIHWKELCYHKYFNKYFLTAIYLEDWMLFLGRFNVGSDPGTNVVLFMSKIK